MSPAAVLARAHLADDDRIDRFQMRRIGLQRQVDVECPATSMSGGGAEMVFHVARALHVVGLEALAAELAEQRRQRLA